ncbi:MAG: hypothetical protein GY699_04940 [Desulfobacteraceae bacterium]|nr:hypothetical protein [Desulfobacteraceae bacterium]
MTDQDEIKVFIAYVIIWAIIGLIFTFLSKKAGSIKKKKMIDRVGFIIISLFILGVTIFLHIPTPGIILLSLAFPLGYYLNERYIFYCPHCIKKTQHLFTTQEFCPKCGMKKDV